MGRIIVFLSALYLISFLRVPDFQATAWSGKQGFAPTCTKEAIFLAPRFYESLKNQFYLVKMKFGNEQKTVVYPQQVTSQYLYKRTRCDRTGDLRFFATN